MQHWTPTFEIALAEMNPGERKVARQLQELLPDEAHIIANYRWQVIKVHKAPVDLETDFVIFWPKRGIVILEVKSGRVDWDPRVRNWTVVSRSPAEQARGSRTDLANRLSKITGPNEDEKVWRDRVQAFPLFPDVERDKFPPVMDGYERDCILGRNEFNNIRSVLERHTNRTAELSVNLTDERCGGLIKKLCPTVHVSPSAAHIIEDESKAIEWATRRQLRMVECLRDQRCVFVSGSAGTGKTIVGLTAMKAWSEVGQKSFFVSMNPHLAQFLRDQHPKQAASIYSLAGFLRDVARCDIPLADPLSENDLLDALSQPKSADRLADISLVLDEAQDFSRDALDGFTTLCDYRRLWILYDDQQVLQKGDQIEAFEQRVDSVTGREHAPIRLNTNLRNTKRICEYVGEWVKTDYSPSEELPAGDPPTIKYVVDESSHDNTLKDLLAELLAEKGYAGHVVLVSCLSDSDVRRKYTSDDGYKKFGRKMRYLGAPTGRGEVRVASVLDFKGQEANVVVLVDTRNATTLNAFYIGGSRAKLRLFVIAFAKPVERPSTDLVGAFEAAGFRI